MPELRFSEIETITADVNRQEITFSHLADELIDHICCEVEAIMQKGLEFEEAYKMVKEKIGPRRIKEIQEETLYAVDKKYRTMKNLMKISGVAGTILVGFAALFKIQHWPMAGIMATLGAFTLAFLFMPSSLIVLWKETHNMKRLFLFVSSFFTGFLFIAGTLFKIQHWPFAGMMLTLAAAIGVFCFVPALLYSKLSVENDKGKRSVYIFGAAGMIFYIMGLLFKLQHWPAATILMVAGVILLAFIAFPWYTMQSWKDEASVSAKFIYMVIGTIAIVVPAALITLNLQRSYEMPYFEHQKEQQQLYNYLYTKNHVLLAETKNQAKQDTMLKISSETAELLKFINSIETEMILASEGGQGNSVTLTNQVIQTPTGQEIQYDHLATTFSKAPVEQFLYPGAAMRKELDTRLKAFSGSLLTLCRDSKENNFEKLLDTAAFLPVENKEYSWTTLMAGLHSLGLLKNSILVAESVAFNAVSNR